MLCVEIGQHDASDLGVTVGVRSVVLGQMDARPDTRSSRTDSQYRRFPPRSAAVFDQDPVFPTSWEHFDDGDDLAVVGGFGSDADRCTSPH
jgi:hypothetical protein